MVRGVQWSNQHIISGAVLCSKYVNKILILHKCIMYIKTHSYSIYFENIYMYIFI